MPTPTMQQFEHGDDVEAARQSAAIRSEKAKSASGDAACAAIFGLILHFFSAITTVVTVIGSTSVKTLVHKPGPINVHKIALAKAGVDSVGFAAMLFTTVCCGRRYIRDEGRSRGNQGTWTNIISYTIFAIAEIGLAALTFLSVQKEGMDGIVGQKVDLNNNPFRWCGINKWNNPYCVSGDGSDFYNSNYLRKLMMDGWKASGALEAILGFLYLLATIFLVRNKWFSRKN